MGESGARLLLDIIDGKAGCQSVELETEIVIRESLGLAKPQD
jgi:DNA-binding LacI/PurR family transcriptional regulator